MLTPEAGPEFSLRRILVPSSVVVEVNGQILDVSHFHVDPRTSRLRIEPGVLDTTHSLVVSYRTLPFNPGLTYSFIDTAATAQTEDDPERVAARGMTSEALRDPFAGIALERRGSITRGITTGSNRDVGLESGLRLELSGEVAEGVRIQAMLSDENTPILPEGTTRRLEEFDRVFIQLDAPVGTARLGDIEYRQASTTFARFDRRLQGAAVESRITGAGGLQPEVVVSGAGAITRGRFRSQTLALVDGVQGPYRLRGADGEQFVLVIPGSESVYWDGTLLERGENRDYVVDYATGEIAFTSRRQVTDRRRVLVEFEYSTNQFTRTLMASQAEVRLLPAAAGPRVRLGGVFLREADGSQFLDEFGLTSADSLVLARAGDGPAYRSGIEPVIFDPEAPYAQYVRRDTLLAGGEVDTLYSAVERRPAEGEQVFRIRFAEVGQGNGRYERGGRNLNGIVYIYVGPGRGAYEPVRVLPRPSQQQVFDVYGTVAVLPGVELFGEYARSFHDRNRMSDLSSIDESGGAFQGGMRLDAFPVTEQVHISGHYRRRQVEATFSPFERVRPVEFARQWNLGTGVTEMGEAALVGRSETIDEAEIRLSAESAGEIAGETARMSLGDVFSARRHAVAARMVSTGLPLAAYRGERIESEDRVVGLDGRWSRHLGSVRLPLLGDRLVPGIEVEREDRRQMIGGSDSLARGSFRFWSLRPGVSWTSNNVELETGIDYRSEDEWTAGRIRHAFDAWTISSSAAVTGSALTAEVRAGYRHRQFSEHFRTIEGRADHSALLLSSSTRWRPVPRGLELTASYEATSERTPLLQEIFIRTGPELGQYVWEDLNGDGIIQVDELIPERTPNEGVYARTYVPSDSLISTVTVQARSEIRLDGEALWRGEPGWRGVLSNFASRTSVDVLESTRDDDLARIYLLYQTRYRHPETTMNGRLRIGQLISYRPSSRHFTLDFDHNQLRSQNNRTAGLESRYYAVWRADARWLLSGPWTLRTVVSTEQNRQHSEQFVTRRFDIRSWRAEPEIIFRASDVVHLSTPVALSWKKDDVGERRATLVRIPFEFRYQLPRRMSWHSRAEMAYVRLTTGARGLAEFELTDGRGPGTSWHWGTTVRYSINEFLRASLQYDGRSPEGAPLVHTMRMELSAVF